MNHMSLRMFSFILMCWHHMQGCAMHCNIIPLFMQQAFMGVSNNQALCEICRFTTGCSVRFKCRGVSAHAHNPACKYNPLLCSTLVLPPSSDTGNYAIHSLPSSASNYDSLPIRSHLSSVLEEASGVVERVSFSRACNTQTHAYNSVCVWEAFQTLRNLNVSERRRSSNFVLYRLPPPLSVRLHTGKLLACLLPPAVTFLWHYCKSTFHENTARSSSDLIKKIRCWK